MDDQILALYEGLSTRDIEDAIKEMYDADISATRVSKVTERFIEQVHEWHKGPRDPDSPIVYLLARPLGQSDHYLRVPASYTEGNL